MPDEQPDEQPAEPSVGAVTRHHADELRGDLHVEFGDRFPEEQIDALMTDSLARLAGQAAVEDFLPVLAYRYTRERLMSVARADDRREGSWDVVFVSLSGGGRGQLAGGLTTALSGGAVSAHAAGSDAEQGLDSEVEQVLDEVRRVRDDIERRVRALLDELGCPISEPVAPAGEAVAE